MLVSACAGTKENKAMPNKDPKHYPFAEIKESCNFIVCIRYCPEFLKDMEEVKAVFKRACRDANFEHNNLCIETLGEHLSIFNVYGIHGYAALYTNREDSECVLEFFCRDNSYDYEEFIAGFMIPFNIMSNPDIDYTWTDLLR